METKTETIQETRVYPLLSERYKAVFVDGLVMIALTIISSFLFDSMGHVSSMSRKITWLFIFVLYEPLMVSIFGGSIGHFSNNLKVVTKKDEDKKLPIYLAVPRYLAKLVLGIASLITVTKKNEGRALHDMLVGSLVVFRKS